MVAMIQALGIGVLARENWIKLITCLFLYGYKLIYIDPAGLLLLIAFAIYCGKTIQFRGDRTCATS